MTLIRLPYSAGLPWEQSDLDLYCLQYMIPKNLRRLGADEQKF